jgi:hypothetical protein
MTRKTPLAAAWISAMDRFIGPSLIVLILALWFYTRAGDGQPRNGHLDASGMHGGRIVALAGDRFHAEAIVEKGGMLRLFMLGQDETRVMDIPSQPLIAFAIADDSEATSIPLTAAPQPGDAEGRTSQFIGQLPPELQQRPLAVTVPNVRIGRERLRISFTWSSSAHSDVMPAKLTDEAERELYLVAGGRYTAADIAANGNRLPSQVFLGFRARHDFDPQPGERICPVSRTKADPRCAWIVDGRRYEFCCPPCIDEFVVLAKEQPDKIARPEAYVAGSIASGGFCTGVSTTATTENK